MIFDVLWNRLGQGTRLWLEKLPLRMGRRSNLENTIALEVEAMSRKILIQCQSRNKLFVLCLTSNDIERKVPQTLDLVIFVAHPSSRMSLL